MSSRWIFAVVALLALPRPGAADAPDVAFVWFGEPDPTGADQAFLALGRRRGMPAVRETPGQLGEELLGRDLSRAVAAAQALDFKTALGGFADIERAAIARGGGSLSQAELVDLYATRAGVHTALGEDADAWDDLLEAAALAPGRPLDPARYPPRLIEAARRATEALPATRKLSVTITPADALVVVDGQLLGRGHGEIVRPPGRHFVRVERAGFVSVGKSIELGPTDVELHLALEAVPAPASTELARRGLLTGARRTLGAFIASAQGKATLTFVLLDNRDGATIARATLTADERVTSGSIAAAVESLLGDESTRAHPLLRRPVPWYRRPLVWGLVGGATATALGVGLGVGLTQHAPDGVSVQVNLGTAR